MRISTVLLCLLLAHFAAPASAETWVYRCEDIKGRTIFSDCAEKWLAGTIVFALVVYQFFHELRTLRTTGGDTVSLSANFLCGVSLLTSVTFVYLSATLGCAAAFDSLATGVLGLAVMVYLFLREMPDTMVTV